jgi:hypothetical protein
LHRLGDGFGVAIVILVALQKRLHVLGGDQAHVRTSCPSAWSWRPM